ncbi:MAG: hypothetical protein JSR59_02440 [Proteobacteria bacterium]|nr:hypothetical protein [Pseudomonadota bacterium]
MLGSRSDHDQEEHHMPCIEAMLAFTMVLMTGYCQSLQAAQHPARRLHLGAKIDSSLAELARDPHLSDGFRGALTSLHQRWQLMSACTAGAPDDAWRYPSGLPAPERLQ